MQFRIGTVYHDEATGVDFVAVQERLHGDGQRITFLLVNALNWIVLGRYEGTLLSSGDINCVELAANYKRVAAVDAYFRH